MRFGRGVRLELDFAPWKRAGWAAWTLLAVGILVAADLGRAWYAAQSELATVDAKGCAKFS